MELSPLNQNRPFVSRFKARRPPPGIPLEDWSEIEDYHEEMQKNGVFVNFLAWCIGSIVLRLGKTLYDEMWQQTTQYGKTFDRYEPKKFQHLPELKLFYLYTDYSSEHSNEVGINPAFFAGGMMILTGVIGYVEYIMGRLQCPFFFLTRTYYCSAAFTIFLTFFVYLNNASALLHRKFVEHAWFGLGAFRNTTGFCHMYPNQTEIKYILPLHLRNCEWLEDVHGLQILFCSYCWLIAATQMSMVRQPAWGGWTKQQLVRHCQRWW